MIITISPAKKLDIKDEIKTGKHTTPQFLSKSKELMNDLRQFSPKDLAVLMNVSNDIANLTFERYSKWKTPFDNKNSKQALHAFKGDVYRSMDPKKFSSEDMDFAQNHLRILSGLYGMLRPLDLIQPYRLEMGIKFKTSGGKDLYEFWSDTITKALNKELQKQKSTILINLASQEYFKVIQSDSIKGNIVTPVFKEYRNDKYKVLGILAKRARGMMCRFIIQNRLDKVQDIKLFNEDGYSYDDNMSTEAEWVFTR